MKNWLIQLLGGVPYKDVGAAVAAAEQRGADRVRETHDMYQRKIARIKGRLSCFPIFDDYGRKIRPEDLLA